MLGKEQTQYCDGIVFSQSGVLTVLEEGTERLICHSEAIHTPLFMGIGTECVPRERISISKVAPQSVDTLYQDLMTHATYGLAIVGLVHFSHCEEAYLKSSPIYHELINAHREKYWQPESVNDCWGFLFGILITEEGQKYFPPEHRSKGFYKTPKDPSATLMSHTHLLRLKNRPKGTLKEFSDLSETANSSEPSTVYHLLNHSQVTQGDLFLFPVDSITL